MYNWKQKYKNNAGEEGADALPYPSQQPLLINMGDQMASANIRVIENKIFFYGEIDIMSMLELNRILVEVDIKLQNTKNILGDEYTPIIHLHVNTPGGAILDAFSCVDTIRVCKSKVYTYADGLVASAGTLICAVGSRRFVGRHAHMLIHQLSGGMIGTYSEMEDHFMNSSNFMKLLKNFYKVHTKIPMKKLDEILKKDIYFTADECVQYGMVDSIL